MAQSITLTASMRSNLSSLKSIQKQMDTTQERLSTGKKVNTAIDNASSFYQARALTNRAGDLDALLDSMGQGIQTIQAANEGIEAVTSYVEQLKSIANSAFALDPTVATYEETITSYKEQYDRILNEIDTLVKDSSYQGVNLLTGGKLTVTFNETRSHRFTVQGDDIVKEMDLTPAAEWEKAYPLKDATHPNAVTAEFITDFGTDGVEGTADDVKETRTVAEAGATIYNVVTAFGADGVEGGTDDTIIEAVKVGDVYYAIGNSGEVTPAAGASEAAVKTEENTDVAQSYADSIDKTLDELSVAIDYLRSYSTELGNNFSIIETRQNFTDALIDVLETGSDNLVLADMNEESANYLALQTRQQLATNSLSLASQSAQSVLSLFQ